MVRPVSSSCPQRNELEGKSGDICAFMRSKPEVWNYTWTLASMEDSRGRLGMGSVQNSTGRSVQYL